jgi:ribose transport system ATP-binding protein
MEDSRLSIRQLNKSFSAPVLQGVNLSLAHGEIHALVGENGAGKTTLVNILAGLLAKDCGEMVLDGANYEPAGPKDAFNAGVSSVSQELSIVATLSVAENVSLRKLPHCNSVIRRRLLREQAINQLERVGLGYVSPDLPAGKLSLAERQLLELAKALAVDCRLLMLDEPTSALAGHQADRLHEVVSDVAAAGTSIIYISHRLDDVLDIANQVTVLRDGQVVSSTPASSLTVGTMMEQMTGRRDLVAAGTTHIATNNSPVLEVENVVTEELPHPVSFSCRGGEIIGIAGLAGSGKSELLEAMFGVANLSSGHVVCRTSDGLEAIRDTSHAVKCGIGYLGADRQTMGLFQGQSVLSNITLPGLARLSSGTGVIDSAREIEVGNVLLAELAIKCADLHQDFEQLSGGNQQKALIARWIHCDSDILLLDEPTRGVDVGTKNAIYTLLFQLQRRGKTIVVASSEIDELLVLSGRILVLSNRKLVQEFSRPDWSEAQILAAAFQEFTPNSSASIAPTVQG